MRFPTSSIRGFFEILAPGVFLLLNIIAFTHLCIPNLAPKLTTMMKPLVSCASEPILFVTLLIIVGCLIGVALRILKNAEIDSLSSRYIGLVHPAEKEHSWIKDVFFYPNWMRQKCWERLPAAVMTFYERCWGDKDKKDQKANTVFFNFCKAIITSEDPRLADEVYSAEAMLRFLAGSFYALLTSVALLGSAGIYVAAKLSLADALPVFAVVLVYVILLHFILTGYRPLRCKEVDTVFHACFVNRERFETLLGEDWQVAAAKMEFRRARRKELLQDTWQEQDTKQGRIRSVSLDNLIEAMRSAAVREETRFLSSLYFAGADVDHPFFLRNDKIAVGIAVLPEDEDKAGASKRHPYQTEIIIVLEGSLSLFCHQGGEKSTKHSLREGDHFIVPKNTCHWIEPAEKGNAAYMFVKTNPDEAPREEPCDKKPAETEE